MAGLSHMPEFWGWRLIVIGSSAHKEKVGRKVFPQRKSRVLIPKEETGKLSREKQRSSQDWPAVLALLHAP